jgi:hypothetical protein
MGICKPHAHFIPLWSFYYKNIQSSFLMNDQLTRVQTWSVPSNRYTLLEARTDLSVQFVTEFLVLRVWNVVLSSVMVIMLATGPMVRKFKSCQERWIFLRAIKICSTTSFGEEVKPSASCHKILQHVKDSLRYNRYWWVIFSGHFLPSFSLLRY